MMDIQKEREAFESWWEGFHNGRQIACDYVEEDNSYSVGYANAQWVAWQAKAQAVPEGFVLVPKDSLKVALSWMNEDIDPWQMGGDSFAELYEHKPILEKAMIKTQELAND